MYDDFESSFGADCLIDDDCESLFRNPSNLGWNEDWNEDWIDPEEVAAYEAEKKRKAAMTPDQRLAEYEEQREQYRLFLENEAAGVTNLGDILAQAIVRGKGHSHP